MPDEPETSYYNVPGRRAAADPYGGQQRARGAEAYSRTQDAYADPTRYSPGYGASDGYDEYGEPTRAEVRQPSTRQARNRPTERGLPGWMAVLLLVVIAGVAGLIDSISGSTVRGVFNWGLVVASLIAILVVRRSQMFPVVIAPPLVYLVASAGLLYVRTGGLSSRSKILDVATNWIVYGFPAIAGATAAVLVVAGIRLVLRK